MKVISIANQKGGCGKTTMAVNVAAALSKLGNRTLLIDLDPQAHATFALGYGKKSSERKTSYDIFRAHFDNAEVPHEEIVITDRESLSFIPANMMLSAAEINLGGVNGAAAILSRTLSKSFFEGYEYVVIDSPPSFGFLTLNSMYAADMIIVPLDLSYFSFNGINSVYRVISLLNAETGRRPSIFFVLNIFDKRSNFAKQLEKDAKRKLGPYLLPSKIRASVRLKEAAKQGKTIFEYDPKCSGALDFYNLTSEILTAENTKIDVVVKEFFINAPQAGAVYVLGRKHISFLSKSKMVRASVISYSAETAAIFSGLSIEGAAVAAFRSGTDAPILTLKDKEMCFRPRKYTADKIRAKITTKIIEKGRIFLEREGSFSGGFLFSGPFLSGRAPKYVLESSISILSRVVFLFMTEMIQFRFDRSIEYEKMPLRVKLKASFTGQSCY